MTTAVQPAGGAGPSSSSLADVIDTILDKGMVIDAFVRVSLVGIELLTIDARIVVASVDTYLRFAEAVNRLEISSTEQKGLPELMQDVTEGGARSKTKGALEGAGEKLMSVLGDDDREPAGKRSKERD
jgi:gas vesicle structural protein